MLIKNKLFFLLLFLTNCANSNPELYSIALEFQKDAVDRGHHVSISSMNRIDYDDTSSANETNKETKETEQALAFCEHIHAWKNGPMVYFQIIVKKNYKFDYFELKGIIYHELGHCVLGLKHSQDENSIMYSYSQSPRFYKKNWDFLVNQLFYEGK